MSWWIWILAGLALLALEVLIPGGIIFLFFGSAAVIVGLLVALGVGGPLWLQALLFSVLSVFSMLALRRRILRRLQINLDEPDTIDTFLGERVRVAEELQPGAEGKGEFRGTHWTVENVGETAIGAGGSAIVERVEGLRLFIRPGGGETS